MPAYKKVTIIIEEIGQPTWTFRIPRVLKLEFNPVYREDNPYTAIFVDVNSFKWDELTGLTLTMNPIETDEAGVMYTARETPGFSHGEERAATCCAGSNPLVYTSECGRNSALQLPIASRRGR